MKSKIREAYGFNDVQDARQFRETKETDFEDWGIKEDIQISLDQINENYDWTIRYLLNRIDKTEQRMEDIEREVEELKLMRLLYN